MRLCLCGRDGNQGEIIAKRRICTLRREWNTKVSQHTAHIYKLNYRDFVLSQCKNDFQIQCHFPNLASVLRIPFSSVLFLQLMCSSTMFCSFWFWLVDRVAPKSSVKLQLSPRLTAWLCSHSNKGPFNIWKLVWFCATDLPLQDPVVIRDYYNPMSDAWSVTILLFCIQLFSSLPKEFWICYIGL